MTPVQLMEDLKSDLQKVLRHLSFPDELTGDTTGISVFQYGLPIEKTQDDRKKKFPYVLILPDEGAVEDSMSPQTISVQLLIGIFDKGMENQGKKHVLNVINDICERFLKDPGLEGRYYADEKIVWVVDKEEEHPYHYGAVWLTFHAAAYRRESELA